MTKVDLKKELHSYRARHGEFRVVDVPPTRYLMIHGQGDPNTAQGARHGGGARLLSDASVDDVGVVADGDVAGVESGPAGR